MKFVTQLVRAGLGHPREDQWLCLIGVEVVLQDKKLQCTPNLHKRGKVEGNDANVMPSSCF